MIPAPFGYERPNTVNEVLALLTQKGSDARVLAGGQSLLPQLKARAIMPNLLIDLSQVTDLPGLNCGSEVATFGALTRQHEILEHQILRQLYPLFASSAFELSDPVIRNRGTFVGALAEADPRSDWVTIALALDVEVHVRSAGGDRSVSIDSLLLNEPGMALRPDELVTHVTIPVRNPPPRMAYLKFPHPASGYALVCAAVAIDAETAGAPKRCRIAVAGLAERPFRADSAEAALCSQSLAPRHIADAAELAVDGVEILSDPAASLEYRALLAKTLVKRALLSATATVN